MKNPLPTDGKIHEIYDMVFELMDHEQSRKQVLKFINDIWKTKKELREILKYENEANRPFVASVEIIKEILGE